LLLFLQLLLLFSIPISCASSEINLHNFKLQTTFFFNHAIGVDSAVDSAVGSIVDHLILNGIIDSCGETVHIDYALSVVPSLQGCVVICVI
jgi:hypothetical protein